ncbi:MAG TPA: hypothetical protein VGL13_07225, partial [Polyangiaceae bacterium]
WIGVAESARADEDPKSATPAPAARSMLGAPEPRPAPPSATPPLPADSGDEPITFRASRTPDEPPVPGRAGRPTTMEQVSEASMQEIRIGGSRARYTLNFFGDVSFALGDPQSSALPPPDNNFPSFFLGDQTFLLRGELGKHLVATTEWSFEIGDTVDLDVERMLVRWQGDNYFVEAGRMHTAFGYWNNAYHHGRWLQPTIVRPRWVAFEDDDGIIPVHLVGIDAGLKLKTAAGSLNLTVSLGNGRGKVVDDVRSAGDYQAGKAVQASIEYVGMIWPDLRLGVSGMYDKIPGQSAMDRPALPNASIDEWIGGVYIAYPSVPLLLIAEGYLVDHKHANQEWTTYGGFGLIGYNIGAFTPYVQVERVVSSGGQDPFFVPDPTNPGASWDTVSGIAGLRIDISDWTALKAEYRYTSALDRNNSVVHQGILNWSWGF